MHVEADQVEVHTTSGDQHLGGQDVDDKIIAWLVAEIKEEMDIDIDDFPRSKAVLRGAANKAKEQLSSEFETTITIDMMQIVDVSILSQQQMHEY